MSKRVNDLADGDSSSSDDEHENKSFVRKVKSRVSDFIPPSLSKWFGAKVRHREEVDEDAACEVREPPPKRVRKYSTREENLFDMKLIATPMPLHAQSVNPFSMTDPYKDPIAGPSASNQTRKLTLSTAPNHIKQITANRADRSNGGDSDSGESTSGYSSMPRIGSKEQVTEFPDRSNAQATITDNTDLGRSIFNTTLPLERTLFGGKMTSPQKHNASLSMRRPAFNASVFGTPNFMDKTLSTRRIVNSPFYNGRITYGGASAASRTVIPTRQAEPAADERATPKKLFDSNATALSRTAKRILDTLDQYNSPVQDARRIPCPGAKRHRVDGLIGKYVGVNPYTTRESPKVPSNKELQVPTTSDLLKMKLKERLQESTSSVRELASSSSASINEYTAPANAEDDNLTTKKSTNKMKTKVASVRQRHNVDDEAVPKVNLPNIQLPISTLPSFNITIPPSKPSSVNEDPSKPTAKGKLIEFTSITVTPGHGNKKTNVSSKVTPSPPFVNFNAPEMKDVALKPMRAVLQDPPVPSIIETPKSAAKQLSVPEFKFSKPVVIAEFAKSIKAINHFKFSKPLVKRAFNGDSVGVTGSSKNTGFGDAFKLKANQWECAACLVRNDASSMSCVSCATTKPMTSETEAEVKLPSWGDRFKPATDTWECSMCLVRNNASKSKCVACESPKPSIPSIPAVKADFGPIKPKADEWECPTCMVRNSKTENKCACCETLQPKLVTATSTWGAKFKTPSNTWECCMCLVRNNIARDQCEACENARPSNIAPPKHVGMKKDDEWECLSCMVRNPNKKTRCVCCEASKPINKPGSNAQATEVPKFSFGIDNGLINGHGFMFGIPTNSSSNKKAADDSKDKAENSVATELQYSFGVKPPNGAKTDVMNASDKPAMAIPHAASPTFNNHFAPITSNETRIVVVAQPTTASTETREKTAFPLNGDKNLPEPPAKKPSFGVPVLPISTVPLTFASAEKSQSQIENAPEKAINFEMKPSGTREPAKSAIFGKPPSPAGGFNFPASGPSAMFNAKPIMNGPASSFPFAPLTSNKELIVDKVDNPLGAIGNGGTSKGSSLFSGSTFGATTPALGAIASVPVSCNFPPSIGSTSGTGSLAAKESFPMALKKDEPKAPAFGTPLPTSIFGSTAPSSLFSKPVENGVFTFGAGGGGSQQPTDTNKAPFQFGSAIANPSPGAFKFGSTAPRAPQTDNGGFNFGSNANNAAVFDASAKPTFNFTAGSVPPMFTAQASGTAPQPTGRNYRKAIRRMR